MTPQEQAYVNGFLKRASEIGATKEQAMELLKSAGGFWSNIPKALKSGFSAFKNTMQAARPASAPAAKFNPLEHLSPRELGIYNNRTPNPSFASRPKVNMADHLSPRELELKQSINQKFDPSVHLSPGEQNIYAQRNQPFDPMAHLSPMERQQYLKAKAPAPMTASQHVLPVQMMNRGGLVNPLNNSLAALSPQARRLMEMQNRLNQR